ncbi:hypothetical protein [Clostridium botulinum]
MANKLFNYSKFDFIGEIITGKEIVSTNKLSDTSKWSRTRLNMGIKDDSNAQFLNAEYIHCDDVKTCKILGQGGEMFTVNLEDTSKQENIDKASNITKIIIDLETDFELKKEYTKLIFKRLNHEMKKEEDKIEEDIQKIKEYTEQIKQLAKNRIEFCHMKDAIDFLNKAMPVIKDQKIRVTGNVKSNYYKGKNRLQYIPSFIEIVPKETKNQLKMFVDFFYEKDGIDDDNKLKQMIVNGYIGERIKRKDTLFPLSVVLDYTKVNEEIPEQATLLEYMKGLFKIDDKKMVHKIGLEINIINGAEKKEFNEDCLTDMQKLSIKVGKSTIDDFRPKGDIYGDRIELLKVCDGDLAKYPDGSIEAFSVKDIPDYLALDDSDKKISDVKKEEIEEKTDNKDNEKEDMMAKLFGK